MATTQSLDELHFGEGGLLRRFEGLAHLTSARAQIVWAIALTWLPVVLLGVGTQLITGRPEPLLRLPSVHVRLLVAAPLFLLSDQEFPRLCHRTLRQLLAQSFVPDAAMPRFDRLLMSATRFADSPLPETLLAMLAIGLGIGALAGVVPVSGVPRTLGRSPAQIWYTMTDWPFYQFLFWRSLWRWLIWARILFGLSRIDLALVPAHPDRRAGIAFLRLPSIGYCTMLLFAISSVVCAEHGARFSFGMTLASYKPLLAIFAAVGALIAVGPLLFFVPQLTYARRDGRTELSDLATDLSRRVHQRAMKERNLRPGDDGYETERLTEATAIFQQSTDTLSLLLVDRGDVVLLLIATVLPVVPVVLVHVPISNWQELGALLSGGRVP
jgi:hypothetical protein